MVKIFNNELFGPKHSINYFFYNSDGWTSGVYVKIQLFYKAAIFLGCSSVQFEILSFVDLSNGSRSDYPNSSNMLRPQILTWDRFLPILFHCQEQYINYLGVLNSLCWSLHSKLSKKAWHLKTGPLDQKLWTFF